MRAAVLIAFDVPDGDEATAQALWNTVVDGTCDRLLRHDVEHLAGYAVVGPETARVERMAARTYEGLPDAAGTC